MALLGLLRFALASFHVLAWPLLALLYPLYSSIRAIETNSTVDTHKLNTYWVVFSLILLFEHAFTKLLEWFLPWSYIRLLVVFLLVMPHFDGALKESIVRDNFLSEVQRYVKENGPEGVEKLIACKSKSINPNDGQNDTVAVQEMVKKRESTASQVSQTEPTVAMNEEKLSSRKMNEKAVEVGPDKEIVKTPAPKKDPKEWTTVSPLPTQTDATFNPPLGDNKHKDTFEGGTVLRDLKSPTEVQKEWTCALCQVTTTCESNLNGHLQGRKHKAAYEALKAKNQAVVPKIALASTVKTSDQPNNKPEMSTLRNGSKQKGTVNEKVQGQKNSSRAPVTKKHHKSKEELADCVCNSSPKGKIAMHVKKVQSQQTKPNEFSKVKSSRFRCPICNIHCSGEVDMASHLKGKKHRENVQERKPK